MSDTIILRIPGVPKTSGAIVRAIREKIRNKRTGDYYTYYLITRVIAGKRNNKDMLKLEKKMLKLDEIRKEKLDKAVNRIKKINTDYLQQISEVTL